MSGAATLCGMRGSTEVFSVGGEDTSLRVYVLNPGDIVIAMDRPFIRRGLKIARVSEKDLPALLLQRVGRFQPRSELLPQFLWIFLNSSFFQNQLRLTQKGEGLTAR